jgi:hypothetical protein
MLLTERLRKKEDGWGTVRLVDLLFEKPLLLAGVALMVSQM